MHGHRKKEKHLLRRLQYLPQVIASTLKFEQTTAAAMAVAVNRFVRLYGEESFVTGNCYSEGIMQLTIVNKVLHELVWSSCCCTVWHGIVIRH